MQLDFVGHKKIFIAFRSLWHCLLNHTHPHNLHKYEMRKVVIMRIMTHIFECVDRGLSGKRKDKGKKGRKQQEGKRGKEERREKRATESQNKCVLLAKTMEIPHTANYTSFGLYICLLYRSYKYFSRPY